MVSLKKIVGFLDGYLKVKEIKDDSWNGLQFEGKKEVKKVCVAVDASNESFEKAVNEKADLLIVHHGQFWKESNPSYREWYKKRLEILRKGNCSLYGCHLPLDRHDIVGNNAQLLKIFGARTTGYFTDEKVGRIGELKKAMPFAELVERLEKELNTKCFVMPYGKKMVKTIGVCSGGGGYDYFYIALDKKVDAYITGDVIHAKNLAEDVGFNVVFAGHYATETVGVKALAELLKKKFRVKTVFLDLPTGT